MTVLADHWPAFVLLALYFGLMIRHAIIGQRQTKQLEDNYIDGRNMGGVLLYRTYFRTLLAAGKRACGSIIYDYGHLCVGWLDLISAYCEYSRGFSVRYSFHVLLCCGRLSR